MTLRGSPLCLLRMRRHSASPAAASPESDKGSLDDDDDGSLSFIGSSARVSAGERKRSARRKARKKLAQEPGGRRQGEENLSAGERALHGFTQKVLVASALCGADKCCKSLASGSRADEYQVRAPPSKASLQNSIVFLRAFFQGSLIAGTLGFPRSSFCGEGVMPREGSSALSEEGRLLIQEEESKEAGAVEETLGSF